MDFFHKKTLLHTIFRTAILSVVALCFTIIALIGLGALAEDNHAAAIMLAHFAAKSLIAIFAFFAAKIPLLALIKWTTINGWFSALLWRETINPESIKSLFTFSTEAAYLNKKFRTIDILRPMINLYCTTIENRIKFFFNPFTIVIALIKTIENFCIFVVDHLPPKAEIMTPSFFLYRALKGIIILVCELTTILLALIEPLASAPYYLLHFIAITIPDLVMWLFFEFKTKNTPEQNAMHPMHRPSNVIAINTTRYINQKLLHPDKEE